MCVCLFFSCFFGKLLNIYIDLWKTNKIIYNNVLFYKQLQFICCFEVIWLFSWFLMSLDFLLKYSNFLELFVSNYTFSKITQHFLENYFLKYIGTWIIWISRDHEQFKLSKYENNNNHFEIQQNLFCSCSTQQSECNKSSVKRRGLFEV